MHRVAYLGSGMCLSSLFGEVNTHGKFTFHRPGVARIIGPGKGRLPDPIINCGGIIHIHIHVWERSAGV